MAIWRIYSMKSRFLFFACGEPGDVIGESPPQNVRFEEIPRKPMSEDGREVLLIPDGSGVGGQDEQERVVFRRGSNLPSRYNTFISPLL